MACMERREVNYRGRVQGVGFRYTCQRVAAGYPVTGYVRNLPDGSVQLVAEGEAEIVQQFLAAITKKMRDYIAQADVQRLDATGEYSSFEIRH